MVLKLLHECHPHNDSLQVNAMINPVLEKTEMEVRKRANSQAYRPHGPQNQEQNPGQVTGEVVFLSALSPQLSARWQRDP